MRKLGLMILLLAVGVGIGLLVSNRRTPAEAEPKPGAGFAAIPGTLGSEDLTGPYQVVKGWPKDISTLPGNEKWTYGAGESVFAESPNRIYMLFRGELPKMAPPKAVLLPQVGPSLSFPVAGFWRDATTASLPGTGGTDDNMSEWLTAWEGKAPDLGIKGPPYRKLGVDAKWENCLVVVDGDGKIIETWKQWDKLFRRPHSVYISPYDPEKNVWVVDDNMQVIYSSPTMASNSCRPSARRKSRARTLPTSTGRRISIGCPTALSSFRMAIPARASRSSIRTESSSWIGESRRPARTAATDSAGYAPRLLQQRAWDRRRSGDASCIRERSKQPSHPGVRRKRQVPIPMEELTPIHRACICCTSDRATRFGRSTAPPTRWSSGTCKGIFCTPGEPWGCSREASGACMGSAWIRMATSIQPRSITAACRSSLRKRSEP